MSESNELQGELGKRTRSPICDDVVPDGNFDTIPESVPIQGAGTHQTAFFSPDDGLSRIPSKLRNTIKAGSIITSSNGNTYTVLKLVGAGSCGIVLWCRQRPAFGSLSKSHSHGVDIALKIVFPSKESLELSTLEFIQALSHPNILQVNEHFDAIIEGDRFTCIVMDLIQGSHKDLLGFIQSNAAPDEASASKICRQILLALAHCHRRRIVHCDLKPQNVLMDQEGVVRVADWGFSQIIRGYGMLSRQCGTVEYAAPELFNCSSFNEKVDIWSLGVVAYLLISKKFPFEICNHSSAISNSGHDYSKQVVAAVRKLEPNFSHIATASSKCVEFLQALLCRDHHRRPSAEECLVHPWIQQHSEKPTISKSPTVVLSSILHMVRSHVSSGESLAGHQSGSDEVAGKGFAALISRACNRNSPQDRMPALIELHNFLLDTASTGRLISCGLMDCLDSCCVESDSRLQFQICKIVLQLLESVLFPCLWRIYCSS
jgi:serine/threonine protein kinase